MTIDQSHEIKIIKARIKATWMSGDYLRDDDYGGRLTTTTLAGWGSLRLR